MDRYDVLIVGGGHAGAQTAIALRQNGFSGSIAILSEEAELPYERPPLSKEYLSGAKAFERLLIRPAAFWSERDVKLLLRHRVARMDPVARTCLTINDEMVGYGVLVWATGGRARRVGVPGAGLAGVHVMRNREDVDRAREELPRVSRVVVVGGGYIGLEAASVMTKLGKKVVLLESQDRVLARVAGEALSRFFEAEHGAQGVDIRLGVALAAIEGEQAVTGVRLRSGEHIPCEMVVVGVGIIPAVEPLIAAGAAGTDGVDVDAESRTSLPGVFAVGDCARQASPFAGGAPVRVESVQSANEQATAAARAIAGLPAGKPAPPWFWSDQFDLKLQTVGLSSGHDEVIVRGDPASRSFSIAYLRDGRTIALDCVNAVRDYMQGRSLVLEGASAETLRTMDAQRR